MSQPTAMYRTERDYYRVIGQRLRAARLAKGLSQRQVASQLGLAHVAIHYWETAKHRPSLWELRQVERVLGMGIV